MRRSELKSLIKEIVRTCLESPDHVVFKDPDNPAKKTSATWRMPEYVEAVILISETPKKDYYAYLPKKKTVISSNKEHEKRWQEWQQQHPDDSLSKGETATHGSTITRIMAAIPELSKTWKRGTHARLYSHNGHYIIAFWESLRRAREYADQIQQFFNDIGVNIMSTDFEPSGYEGNYISADEFLGSAVAQAKYNTNQMQDKELAHLMVPGDPRKKAAMAKKAYIRPDQRQADRAKMPLAQMKQFYPGKAVAENTDDFSHLSAGVPSELKKLKKGPSPYPRKDQLAADKEKKTVAQYRQEKGLDPAE